MTHKNRNIKIQKGMTLAPLSSSRSVGMRDIKTLLTTPISRIKTLRDDEGRKNTMQTLPDNKGFTLLELLVVVLIIGILAAIALPQYQKAVEKNKAMEAITTLSVLRNAYEFYYLTHGKYATKFSELDIELPFTGQTKYLDYEGITDTRSNKDWSLQIENVEKQYVILHIGRIRGKYKGSHFSASFLFENRQTKNRISCNERVSAGKVLFNTKLPAGAYCATILHGIFENNDGYSRIYRLP